MASPGFRALFFGSPAFAVPSLDALHDIATVAAVVCQPDKPAGRGLAVAEPAVKTQAVALGLPVVQPTKLRTGEFGDWARAQNVDVALVVAYGRILPGDVLLAPRLGCVNVHASLLPKYRGAAPIAWAVANGDAQSGITLMKLDEGMDTGPTFARVVTPIGPDETAGDVGARLAQLGAESVREWLPRFVAGACTLARQDEREATAARLLEKADGRVDWSWPARRVHDHVRGMSPWPGASTTLRGSAIKVRATRVVRGDGPGSGWGAPPSPRAGEVVVADKSGVLVACGEGFVTLVSVQPEGRRAMDASQWAIGRGVGVGDVLGA